MARRRPSHRRPPPRNRRPPSPRNRPSRRQPRPPPSNFRRWLSAPAIQKVLSRSSYDDPKNLGLGLLKPATWKPGEINLEVLREHPFAIRDGDQILSGAIDRLVLIRRKGQLLAADIIDFKTDELPPNNPAALAARTDFYRPQVEAYRRAVAKIYCLKVTEISWKTAYLTGGVIAGITA